MAEINKTAPVKQRTIRKKFMAFILLSVIGILFLNAVVTIVMKQLEGAELIDTKQTELERDLRSRSKIFAEFASGNLLSLYQAYYNPPLSGAAIDPNQAFKEYFVKSMKERLAKNQDIEYIYIYTVSPEMILDSIELEKGLRYSGQKARVVDDDSLTIRIKSNQMSVSKISIDDKPKLDIVMPIVDEYGTHVYSFQYIISYDDLERSLTVLNDQITKATNLSVLIIILLMLFSILVSYFLASFLAEKITHPIQELVEETSVIAAGNFDHEVDVASDDEVGILAQKFEEMRKAIKQNIRDIAKKAMGLEGSLELFSFPDLINFICMGQMKGSLIMESPTAKGKIYFAGGDIVHAHIGKAIQGEEAIYKFFVWTKGSFEFVNGSSTELVTVTEHWQHLLMEGARQTDEMDVIRHLIPGPNSILQLSSRPTKAQKEIKLTGDEVEAIRLIQRNKVVSKIVENSAHAEFETYKILYSLVSSGLVEVLS
ncbi:MAG: hypothetical protein B6244_02080 [Candidatus Cloacimonetes bacterium 4572_55]|nr:MAG: hypothetical protein B6244_02080 [Candidatus Cloacimonetes bacterium 4572_55]